MKRVKFRKIYCEISNSCNLKCEFCPSATDSNVKKQFMSEELFESFSTFTIITQLVGLIPFVEALGAAGVPLVIFLEGILLAFEQVWFPV